MEHDNPMYRIYLRHSYEVAVGESEDPNTQVGAILVDDELGIVSTGANQLCMRIDKTPDKLKYPNKAIYMEHAERNALFLAARRGAGTKELTMYCPWATCVECAKAIIQCGIKKVVRHQELYDHTPDRWKESVDRGWELLKESGIETVSWSGKIGNGVTIIFDGNEFSP